MLHKGNEIAGLWHCTLLHAATYVSYTNTCYIKLLLQLHTLAAGLTTQ